MDPVTQGWQEFLAIVDAGSISAAARSLELPRATLSRTLSALEDRLGTRLLHRTTRQMTLTHQGQMLYTRASSLLQDAHALTQELSASDSPSGLLRVATLPFVGNMANLILDFADLYPQIDLEIHQSPQFVDLIQDRFDVAIRAGQDDPTSRLIRRPLMVNEHVVVASLEYLAKASHPLEVPEDLVRHRCIVGFGGGAGALRHWPLHGGGEVPVNSSFACADLGLQRRAVAQGRGVGLLPRLLCQDLVNQGRVKVCLEGRVGQVTRLGLVYPERAYLPAKVRVFLDHTVSWFERFELQFQHECEQGPGAVGRSFPREAPPHRPWPW